jgi:hypothetical protein
LRLEWFQSLIVVFHLLLVLFLGSPSQFLGIVTTIVSLMSELVGFQIILSSATFLLWILMNDGTFAYILPSFGLKFETEVGGWFFVFSINLAV